MSDAATVLVVDADHISRLAAASLIREGAAGVRLVGETSEPGEAAALAERHRPTVIVLGSSSPGDYATLRSLKARAPSSVVLVLSGTETGKAAFEAMRAGAAGFLPRSASAEEILTTVFHLAAGKIVVHQSVAVAALQWGIRVVNERVESQAGLARLTPREREVVGMLSEGMVPAVIADKLCLSRRTIEAHLANSYRKLGVRGQIDAVRAYTRLRQAEAAAGDEDAPTGDLAGTG